MTHAVELLAQAAIMAVVALGAWTAMGDGMIGHRFRKWIEHANVTAVVGPGEDRTDVRHRFPHWLRNPIASCPRCMCSVWGMVALLVFGFGAGIDTNLVRDSGLLTFDEHLMLVPVKSLPFVVFDWSRIAEIPALILAAVGIQELLHRP